MTDEMTEQDKSEDPKRDLWDEFNKNPTAEKMLAVAALAMLVGFVISNRWSDLFQVWFPTLSFLASLVVIALVGLDLFKVRIIEPKIRMWVLVVLALLPALGFLFDALRDPPFALMLAGMIFMAYAGAKITMREKLIKRSD